MRKNISYVEKIYAGDFVMQTDSVMYQDNCAGQ